MKPPVLHKGKAGPALEHIQRGLALCSRPAIVAIEIALTAGLAVTAARLVWLVLDPGGAVSRPAPILRTSTDPAHQRPIPLRGDTALLTTTNPFAASYFETAAIPDAPPTSLNLKLRGVRASENGTEGVAMIIMPDNRMRTFKSGEMLLEGVTLDRIFADRVTLSKGGQIEALYMAGHDGRFAVLTRPGEPAPSGARSTAIASTGTADVALTDFLANLTIDPVHRDDAFIGYRIGARDSADALLRAGLQPGDIVTGVNGKPVADLSPADFVSRISSPQSVQLRIDRDGQEMTHTLAPQEAR